MNSVTMGTDVVRLDLEKYAKRASKLIRKVIFGFTSILCLVGHSVATRAEVELLHRYGSSLGQEVANVIAVNASKLLPLLPPGYNLVPADSVGFGGSDQGIVIIANFRGIDATVDDRKPLNQNQVAIDVAILVFEPSEAVQAGVSILGAFHFYTLAIYTNDARYAASLRRANIPVEFVNKIGYQRDMNDTTGVGTLAVNVPSKNSPFHTINSGQGYAPVPGAFNAVFWHEGQKGQTVLHFLDEPFRQGTAISQIYTQSGSTLDSLLDGGGLGPCDPHPETGYRCLIAPALNLRYDEGTDGKLLLIR